jgi:hypothetical protein
MRRGALLFPAIGALALLPAVSAPAAVSCRDEVQLLAQTFHLSTGQSSAQPSRGAIADSPATTESRGLAGPDSLESSGGTRPPSTGTPAPEQRNGAAPAQQLGAADRAKAEGLLSEAQAADAQGNGDQCLKILRAAQAMLLKARQ